ncbi:MAG: TetR/AcrR family transcriptional regulator [Sneathiella sp.]
MVYVKAKAGERAGSREIKKILLETVYELVSENGIEETGMRAIADAADVSTGTVNYHFENKHNLLIQAYDAAYTLPDDWEEYKGSAFGRLKKLISQYVFRSSPDRFWRFWVNYTARSTRDEEMRVRQDQRYIRQAAFWTQLLEDGKTEGIVRENLNSKRAAERLLALGHGLVIRQFLSPTHATRKECTQIIKEELESFFAE